MKNLLAITFFVLNGQCWVTNGERALNLANSFAIDQRGDDIHIIGGDHSRMLRMTLESFLKEMREQCGAPQPRSDT